MRSFGTQRDLTILATGSEVHIALAGAALLAESGVDVVVVSMPCWALFDAQDETYRSQVLGDAPRIAIEAASKFGWARYVSDENNVIGMTGFGASAPAEVLYDKFGITADAVFSLGKKVINAAAR